MTVETNARFVSQLNPNLPSPYDPVDEGDQHLNLIKKVLQQTFPDANKVFPILWDSIGATRMGNGPPSGTTPGQREGEIYFDRFDSYQAYLCTRPLTNLLPSEWKLLPNTSVIGLVDVLNTSDQIWMAIDPQGKTPGGKGVIQDLLTTPEYAPALSGVTRTFVQNPQSITLRVPQMKLVNILGWIIQCYRKADGKVFFNKFVTQTERLVIDNTDVNNPRIYTYPPTFDDVRGRISGIRISTGAGFSELDAPVVGDNAGLGVQFVSSIQVGPYNVLVPKRDFRWTVKPFFVTTRGRAGPPGPIQIAADNATFVGKKVAVMDDVGNATEGVNTVILSRTWDIDDDISSTDYETGHGGASLVSKFLNINMDMLGWIAVLEKDGSPVSKAYILQGSDLTGNSFLTLGSATTNANLRLPINHQILPNMGVAFFIYTPNVAWPADKDNYKITIYEMNAVGVRGPAGADGTRIGDEEVKTLIQQSVRNSDTIEKTNVQDEIEFNIKPDSIIPDRLDFDPGTLVGGRGVFLNNTGTGFEGREIQGGGGISPDAVSDYAKNPPSGRMSFDNLPEGLATKIDIPGPALRVESEVVGRSLLGVAEANNAYLIPNNAVIPPDDPERLIILNIQNFGTFTFLQSDLKAKQPRAANQPLNNENYALTFSGVNGGTCYVGHDGRDRFLLAFSAVASYYFTIRTSVVDATARVKGATQNQAGLISWQKVQELAGAITPANPDRDFVASIVGDMAEDGTQTNITVTYNEHGSAINFVVPDASATEKGVVSGADYTKIQNAVLQDDLNNAPALPQLHAGDSALFDDSSDVSSGLHVKKVSLAELDARFRSAYPKTDKHDEILNAFSGDSWSIPAMATNAEYPYVSPLVDSTANPASLDYVFNRNYAYYASNKKIVVKISSEDSTPLENYRLTIGNVGGAIFHSYLRLDDSRVSLITTTGGFKYYEVPVADKPAGNNLYVEKFSKLEILPSKIAAFAKSLLVNAMGKEFTLISPQVQTTSSSSDKLGNTVILDPALDLDHVENRTGILLVSAKVTAALVSGSDPNFGFEHGKANQSGVDLVREVSQSLFNAQLYAAPATSFGTMRAVSAARVPVYSLNTLLGYWRLWAVADSTTNHHVGFRAQYEADVGNALNYNFTSEVRVAHLPFGG